jgi:hypothetical protein
MSFGPQGVLDAQMLTACNLNLPVARERPARMILHDLLVQSGGPVAKIIKACCRRGPTREADASPRDLKTTPIGNGVEGHELL